MSATDRIRVAVAALVGMIAHGLRRDQDIRIAEQYASHTKENQ